MTKNASDILFIVPNLMAQDIRHREHIYVYFVNVSPTRRRSSFILIVQSFELHAPSVYCLVNIIFAARFVGSIRFR